MFFYFIVFCIIGFVIGSMQKNPKNAMGIIVAVTICWALAWGPWAVATFVELMIGYALAKIIIKETKTQENVSNRFVVDNTDKAYSVTILEHDKLISEAIKIRTMINEIREHTLKFPGSVKYFYLDELPISEMGEKQLKEIIKKAINDNLQGITDGNLANEIIISILEPHEYKKQPQKLLLINKLQSEITETSDKAVEDIYNAVYKFYSQPGFENRKNEEDEVPF